MKQPKVYETQQEIADRKALLYKDRVRVAQPALKHTVKRLPQGTTPHQCPQDPHEQNLLIDECYKYVIKNQPESINDFPLSKGMSPYKFKRLGHNNPYFAEILELCMYTIARKIEEEWRHFKCDKTYAKDYLCIYDKDYKEMRKELNSDMANALIQAQPVIPIFETPDDVRRRESGNGESIPVQVQTTTIPDKPDNSPGE